MKLQTLPALWRILTVALATVVALPAAISERPSRDLKEDVVDTPAIGDGLVLSNAFQSHMVLQRDKPLKIWGWAAPGEGVTVAFAGQKAVAKAGDDRAWSVTLEPIPANATPQTLTVSNKNTELVLEDILVGDVWILGGQSNMEFSIAQVNDGQFEIASANFPNLRLLSMPVGKGFDSVPSFERLWEYSSWSSRHFRKGDWEACTPETVAEFSAIGYIFGRRLAMATDIPIGLIDASQGGTTVEAWTPEDVLKQLEAEETRAMMKDWQEKIAAWDPKADLEQRVANYEKNIEKMKQRGTPKPTDLRPGPVADKNRPGCRYASAIEPLKGLAVAGALFHQGFNNCFGGSEGARMYGQVFPAMITAWRATFDDPKLPFGIISLCTAGEPQTEENFLEPMYDAGAPIREAQYRTFVDFRESGDETIGFVSSFDQRKSWYHPQIKVPVGERAAKWAMVTRYGLLAGRDADQHWLPPAIDKVEAVDGTLRLTFNTQVMMPDDSTKDMVGFAIAGEDRHFHMAEVNYYTDGRMDNKNRPVYQKNVLVLSSPMAPTPVHYRHAWARNPLTNIVNNQSIPVATQRSDDWPLEQVPLQLEKPENMDDRQFNRWAGGQQKRELKFDDTARRIKEAKALVEELEGPFLEEKKKREEAK
ncbi:sialate O-acetylesterase [Haloferula sp. A504]|uniref:sialate O-acetylesterase n=1 Tax=Haloferula sp. A504 TaxID=3373601 RepID=UPI0031C47F25|nr:sialate O-acetylesterase [Verrucomicrobiaceae bacterium E54]